jgi:hypothetical protein
MRNATSIHLCIPLGLDFGDDEEEDFSSSFSTGFKLLLAALFGCGRFRDLCRRRRLLLVEDVSEFVVVVELPSS